MPTVVGSVTGGAVVAPAFTLLALGIAFGAIAEVIRGVGRTLIARRDPTLAGAGFAAGVAVMYVTGIFAA
jgi:NO-binding membrane sensor protein with MHYT domain